MKTLKVTVYIIILIVLAVFAGLHTFVSIKGRQLLTKKLNSVFQCEVKIGRVTTSFPLQLIVKDLEVKNWFKIRKVVAGTGMVDIFSGNFILPDLRLQGVEFDLEKQKRGEVSEADKATVNLEAIAGTGSGGDFFLPQHIVLRHLIISDGVFSYIDHTKCEKPIKIVLKDLELRIDNFQWPFSSSEVTNFKKSGRVPWENIKEEGRVEFEGWINFYKKDMRAKLEIKDIDGVYIYPYYSSWVDIDKARVEKARLNFTSNITSLNNDVNAACHLELTQIAFKPKDEQQPQQRLEKITNVVLGMLKAINQGRIVLDFNFKTKLDNPEFGLGVIQEAFRDKIYQARRSRESGPMQIIKLPGKIIEGTFNSCADLTKSVINTTVNVGKELKKAVEGSFAKELKNTTVDNDAAVNQTK
jgi:hypothetical protein